MRTLRGPDLWGGHREGLRGLTVLRGGSGDLGGGGALEASVRLVAFGGEA